MLEWCNVQAEARKIAQEMRRDWPQLSERAKEAEAFANLPEPKTADQEISRSQYFTTLKAGWNSEIGSLRRQKLVDEQAGIFRPSDE